MSNSLDYKETHCLQLHTVEKLNIILNMKLNREKLSYPANVVKSILRMQNSFGKVYVGYGWVPVESNHSYKKIIVVIETFE